MLEDGFTIDVAIPSVGQAVELESVIANTATLLRPIQ